MMPSTMEFLRDFPMDERIRLALNLKLGPCYELDSGWAIPMVPYLDEMMTSELSLGSTMAAH